MNGRAAGIGDVHADHAGESPSNPVLGQQDRLDLLEGGRFVFPHPEELGR